LGATLVAVSPQTPDESLTTVEKAELSFAVLSDADSATSRRYGLVYTLDAAMREVMQGFGNDLTTINGTDTWELPVPATYVIGTDGIVAFAFADPDYRHRAEPSDVLAALRGLTAPAA
jgi:peroxiredoxin